MNKYLNTLCNCSLFDGKEKNEIKNILSLTKYKINHFEKNDFIFRADQSAEYIGIVLKGSIEIQNNLESGKFFNIFYKKKGEIFGEALIFSNSSIYQFDIIAKESSDILLIYKQSVVDVFLKDNTIVSNILNIFAKNVLMLNRKIELFSYSSIQKKIAYCLLYNVKLSNNNTIYLCYSKKAWAEHLNVSRSSLCRELKNLCDNKIIKINNKAIEILEKEKLENILNNV